MNGIDRQHQRRLRRKMGRVAHKIVPACERRRAPKYIISYLKRIQNAPSDADNTLWVLEHILKWAEGKHP